MTDIAFWYLGLLDTYGLIPVLAVQLFALLTLLLFTLAAIDRIEGRRITADDTDREETP